MSCVRNFGPPVLNGTPTLAVLLSSLRGLSNSIAGFFEVTSAESTASIRWPAFSASGVDHCSIAARR